MEKICMIYGYIKKFWYFLVVIFKIVSVYFYYFYMGVFLGYFKRGLVY